MKSFWLALASMTVAGISFWAPNVMLFPRMNSMSSFFTEITFACPLSLLAVYGAATWCRSRYQRTGAGPSFALFGLIGVWVFGPWLMALAGTLAGGPGFHRASDYTPFLWMSICPPLTLYFSSMQGNVFGLILATILMPVCHWVFEKQHWFVPPALKRRFHLHHNHPVAD
jgi:hypothetical protein